MSLSETILEDLELESIVVINNISLLIKIIRMYWW